MLTQDQVNFHIREHSKIKENALYQYQETNAIVRYMLISNAGIIAWYLSRSDFDAIHNTISIIPIILTLVFFALWASRQRFMDITYRYLGMLEEELSGDGLGWERYYASQPIRRRIRSTHVHFVVFVLNIILTGAFAVIVLAGKASEFLQ